MPVLDGFFKYMIEGHASDLHMEEGQKPKLRLHGKIEALNEYDVLTRDSIGAMMKEVVDEDSWKKFERRGDLDFAYTHASGTRFRGNYFRHFYGYGAIFRVIPSVIKTLEELQLPPAVQKLAELHSGLVLVTGPTGSGKSTTLAAMINHINAGTRKRIVTIEEPVEFMHPNKKSIITHREVGPDTETFTTGLTGGLKSNADVILVGEMRDRETIRLALTAAEKGILVFGTLHTNSAAKTIDRIVDIFPASEKNQIRYILADNLQGIISQQLLRSLDGSRRWASYEILLRTTSIVAMIRNGETNKMVSEMQLNGPLGMILMDSYLRRLVLDKKVSEDEAFMKAQDKASFRQSVSGKAF